MKFKKMKWDHYYAPTSTISHGRMGRFGATVKTEHLKQGTVHKYYRWLGTMVTDTKIVGSAEIAMKKCEEEWLAILKTTVEEES